jgi:hypothetical protein
MCSLKYGIGHDYIVIILMFVTGAHPFSYTVVTAGNKLAGARN